MKVILAIFVSVVLLAKLPAQETDLDLYKRHDWFSLQSRIASGSVHDPLIVGATAAAFDDEKTARSKLLPLLSGEQAEDAHTWLSYLDLRHGRYKAAASHLGASAGDNQDPLAVTLGQLPDQVTTSSAPASLPYRIFEHKLFLPASLNGKPVEFFMDSDANLSLLSETAAKRFGLFVRHSTATMDGALGAKSGLSITTADVIIGSTRIVNVAFFVLPDNAALFATLSPEQQGALGLPVILALRKVSWGPGKVFKVGDAVDPTRPSAPLAFDGSDPIVRFRCNDVMFTGLFDTGAETTTLWPPFATQFSSLLKAKGTPGSWLVRGFGGSGNVPEVALPHLTLSLGGIDVEARPAHVLTGRTTSNSDWLAGRLGLDLLLQARQVTIDFTTNKLQLTN